MFIKSEKGTMKIIPWSEMPDRRRYRIDLLSIPGDIWSDTTHIAEVYSKGIAYRVYTDLLKLYTPESIIMH